MLAIAQIAAVSADRVLFTINIGDFHWSVTVGTLIYLAIAALIGLIAEFIVGWRLPFGIVGAILAAVIGMWIFSNLIPFSISGDPVFYGIPLIKALIGAIILVAIWHLLTYRGWSRRRRYYRRA